MWEKTAALCRSRYRGRQKLLVSSRVCNSQLRRDDAGGERDLLRLFVFTIQVLDLAQDSCLVRIVR